MQKIVFIVVQKGVPVICQVFTTEKGAFEYIGDDGDFYNVVRKALVY